MYRQKVRDHPLSPRTTEVNYKEPIGVLLYRTNATAFRYSMSVQGSYVAEGNGSLATFLRNR
jgi:hypothetical protein